MRHSQEGKGKRKPKREVEKTEKISQVCNFLSGHQHKLEWSRALWSISGKKISKIQKCLKKNSEKPAPYEFRHKQDRKEKEKTKESESI